jgi:hypothetical protein
LLGFKLAGLLSSLPLLFFSFDSSATPFSCVCFCFSAPWLHQSLVYISARQ